MRVSISVNRPFHSVLMANTLSHLGHDLVVYSAAPRGYFSGLDDRVRTKFVPAPILGVGYKLGLSIPDALDRTDTWLFDRSVALLASKADLLIGWASQALASAKTAKNRGERFVLDRACPHRDFQDSIMAREAERVGARIPAPAAWFRDRQLEEYELADVILAPSAYTMSSFPEHLQPKLLKAPLLGRCRFAEDAPMKRNETFTVGVVGGNPLRKGYLYLLKAWEKLGWKNARLLLRTGDFAAYPELQSQEKRLSNVERVGYVADISDFYRRCDVFVLPSVDDGFGMALIEAMANRRACIATAHCGASEIVTSGKDGIVVPPGDTDALAEALQRVYEDEPFRQSLAAEGAVTARNFAESRAYERSMEELMGRLAGTAFAT